MSQPATWNLIEQLLADGAKPNQPDDYRVRLNHVLRTLSPRELLDINHGLLSLRIRLRQRRHWVAASLLTGELCDDEPFGHVRGWLIAHGRAVYESVLEQPDRIADLAPRIGRDGRTQPFLPAIVATPGKALMKMLDVDGDLREKFQTELQHAYATENSEDAHIGWAYWPAPTVQELTHDLPDLWRRWGNRWQEPLEPDDPLHPFAGFIEHADVPGLGPVGIGDTLVRRHDGSTFTVLGISDIHATFAPALIDAEDAEANASAEDAIADAMAFGEGDYRYIARVRNGDGSVQSNQGLSSRYQRRPDQPDLGPPDDPEPESDSDDEYDLAWEARSEAIQARLLAAMPASDSELRVTYSAYEEDDDGLPVDNLDEIAFEGVIRFVEIDPSDGERYDSEILESPRWIDVALVANRAMLQLGYHDHVYLEGIEVQEQPPGHPAIGIFLLGS